MVSDCLGEGRTIGKETQDFRLHGKLGGDDAAQLPDVHVAVAGNFETARLGFVCLDVKSVNRALEGGRVGGLVGHSSSLH